MALRIDAGGKYLSRTTNLPSDVSSTFSMCFWVQYVGDNTQNFQIATAIGSGSDLSNWLGGYDPYQADFDWRSRDSQAYCGIGTQPTNGVWYWFGLTVDTGSPSGDVVAAGGSLTWDATAILADATPTQFTIGAHWADTANYWCNCRILAVKMWTAALTTTQMAAEQYWYEPQVTSNVHAWYPLIDSANDHSANAYHMTPTGSPSYEDYTPAGMNALQGTGDPGQIDSVISL